MFLFALCPDTTEPFFCHEKEDREKQFPQRFCCQSFWWSSWQNCPPDSFALMREKKKHQILRYSSTLLFIYLFNYLIFFARLKELVNLLHVSRISYHQMKLNVQLLTIFDFVYHPNQCFFFPNRFCHFPNQKIGILLGQKIFFSVKSSDFPFFGKNLEIFSYENIEGKKTQPSMPLYFPQWIFNIFILPRYGS